MILAINVDLWAFFAQWKFLIYLSYGIVIIITAKTGHRAIISAGKCLGSLSGVAHSLIRIQAGYRWESRKV